MAATTIWFLPAPRTDQRYWLPNRRSAVRLMCSTSSGCVRHFMLVRCRRSSKESWVKGFAGAVLMVSLMLRNRTHILGRSVCVFGANDRVYR